MVQLIPHCNYTAYAHTAIEITLLPKDKPAPWLITEQTYSKERGNSKQRCQGFESKSFTRNNLTSD